MDAEIAVAADGVVREDDSARGAPGERRMPRLPVAFLPEVAALALVVIWASTFILTKDAYTQILPMAYSFARYLLVSILGLLVLAIRGRRDPGRYWRILPGDRMRFVWCGLFGFTIYQVCFSIGVDRTSAFASSLLTSIIPLFSLALVTVLGERPSRQVWIGVWVAIVGVCLFLMQRGGGTGMLGNLLCLAAAACFAIYSEMARPLVRRYPAETVAAYTMLFGTLPLLVVSLPQVMAQDWAALEPKVWLIVAYTVVFPVYLALMVWNWIIAERGVAATGWNLLVPVASGVMAVIFLGDAIGPIQMVGAALALCGLVLMQSESLRGRPVPPETDIVPETATESTTIRNPEAFETPHDRHNGASLLESMP
ncbi:MAG: DMT family transporter [Thermomicrobiales bacterium]